MDWLRRVSRETPPGAPPSGGEVVPEAVEGTAPGVASLMKGVTEDRSHAVLDLGPATDQSLRVYGRFARWVRFADLLGDAGWPRGHSSAAGLLGTLLPQAEHPYDIIFAWDIIERFFPEDRPRLVQRLADITAPGARLHAVVRAAEDVMTRPLRFTLIDVGRIRYEVLGTARLPPSRLLPAEVAKVLAPWQVVHAFNLKIGLREYVAERRR
ncbi:MAG TPA: class I SAM-dependent methyltransferase [Longimicrobiales bacterium]